MAPTQREVLRTLLDDYGRTYAHEAGIRLTDTPQPLYRLLVLSCLLSARIRAGVAVAAAKELSAAGMRDPKRMAEATWQQRVDALGRGGYRRYDERTATQLGDGARLVTERYGGDLRRLREQAGGDVAEIRRLLREFPGLGPRARTSSCARCRTYGRRRRRTSTRRPSKARNGSAFPPARPASCGRPPMPTPRRSRPRWSASP